MLRPLLAVLLLAPAAIADPLKFMPKEASVVLKIESPRAIVESVVKLDAWKSVQAFPQVKETLDSAQVRRLLKLLAHLEKETALKWPDLLDQVAGNGIALGFKPQGDPNPVLAVMEGRDEKIVEQVSKLFVAGFKEESEKDGKGRVTERDFRGVPTLAFGDDSFYARRGTLIFISNRRDALEAGLALALDEGQSIADKPSLQKARSLVGKNAAAWLWFDLAAAKETQEGKDFFANSRKEITQFLLFGSSVDAARRADFLAAGLDLTPDGYSLSIRIPAKRAELEPMFQVHVPRKGMGSKPLLEPPGVVLSQSFYLDLGHLWKNRKTIISDAAQLKDLEKGTEDISKLLPGTTFGKILEQLGPHHRLVMAQTGEKLYGKEPGQPIPPAAYLVDLRDPALSESLDGILRSAGLLVSFQTLWKLSETTHDGVKIATYRFPEGAAKFPDEDNLRFNAAPSFAIANDQLILGSTPGIVKALLPLLKNETGGSEKVWTVKAYATGAADVIHDHPDAAVTDAILKQGITLAEARAQVKEFAGWLGKLGTATLSIKHGTEFYRFDAEWHYAK